MKEANEKKARFAELELEDFERICEFAYRGDYTPPTWQTFPDFENSDSKKRAIQPTGPPRLVSLFRCVKDLSSKSLRDANLSSLAPGGNYCPSQDFGPTFLAYARLYVFAEQYMVNDLKELTLRKLHLVLRSFQLYTTSSPAILELARFAYNDDYTSDHGNSKPIDKLRQLVVQFIGMHVQHFNSLEDHRSLMLRQGEYSGDLLDALHKWT